MGELHVFEMSTGCDFVVAADDDDAWSVWCEFTGEDRADYEEGDDWERKPGDESMTIRGECGDAKSERRTMTCAEWAAENGRGFLSSTEC